MVDGSSGDSSSGNSGCRSSSGNSSSGGRISCRSSSGSGSACIGSGSSGGDKVTPVPEIE